MRQTAPAARTPPLERIPSERTASLELVRITKAAAIAAAHWMGHGNNNEADQAAVDAARKAMEETRFNGLIVIGDRPRHEKLINDVRAAGARIKLIEDGDLMASLSVPIAGTDVHAVMGTGGAPEGVLAAAALRCLGAEILGRLRFRNDEERRRAKKMGVANEDRVYRTEDLASGTDIRFVATGVTDGEVLKGVHFFARGARTHSLLLDRLMGKLRFIDTTHFEDIDHPPLIRLE